MANEKPIVLNALVRTTQIKVPANEMLGTSEKNMNYLLIITDKGTVQINVGDKTYNSITEIIKGGKQ